MLQTVRDADDATDLLQFAPPLAGTPRLALAVQAIVSLSSERRPAWVECLVRPPADRPGQSVMDLVRAGYARRGDRFDLDVLDAALRRMPALRPDTRFGVNIRPGSLMVPDFVDAVLERLHRAQVAPDRLVLELVEYAGAVNLEATARPLNALRRAGVQVALDDFGPGAANLDVVAAGLVDWIKLDRSVCRCVDTHDGARRVVEGLAALVRHAGPGLVAEGIERPAQMQLLHGMGIVHQQGFLFHRPALLVDDLHAGSTH
ncbi:EAL domain-containing protein [Wenzhouxiangella sp. XN79A]|uniref:EAL domain-containing protein n=1 Tax=Wenzhouxiangella sp. XN79A TaxID=2724193 RepID=UPI00144A8ACB|nr:EAL domain-containing protein [Wenzhouxiangella sp. XN79A]NKI36603.1 EAL domain-containing protein [Wenzhouxiangella sp. XN79A]